MDNIYKSRLYFQFCYAKGYDAGRYDEEIKKEFEVWIKDLKEDLKCYKEYLLANDIEVDSPFVAEINKGVFDTISGENTKIISPYIESDDGRERKFIISYGSPRIYYGDHIEKLNGISSIITHNPYLNDSLKAWEFLPRGGLDILVGVFGRKTDLDIDFKRDFLDRFYLRMDKDNSFISFDSDDTYYYAITGSKGVKKRVR